MLWARCLARHHRQVYALCYRLTGEPIGQGRAPVHERADRLARSPDPAQARRASPDSRARAGAEDYNTLYHRERQGDVVRALPGNIGYVDLDRLQPGEVDGMCERLAQTVAIIFDMRGYPNGTVWSIAPRLAEIERTTALIVTPTPGHASPGVINGVVPSCSRSRFGWVATRYSGRPVMLIDERTQSQAEHTGLFLRAANGTQFIGSRTAWEAAEGGSRLT